MGQDEIHLPVTGFEGIHAVLLLLFGGLFFGLPHGAVKAQLPGIAAAEGKEGLSADLIDLAPKELVEVAGDLPGLPAPIGDGGILFEKGVVVMTAFHEDGVVPALPNLF